MQYGILIGRFQPIHKAHQSIIDEILHDGRIPLIFIGSSNTTDKKNPFSYIERAAIIHKIYGDSVITLPLPDYKTDIEWMCHFSEHIWSMGINKEDCIIYFFKKEKDLNIKDIIDEFAWKEPTYHKIYDGISATKIRRSPDKYKQYLDGRVLKMLYNK